MRKWSAAATSKELSRLMIAHPWGKIPEIDGFDAGVLSLFKAWQYSFRAWCNTSGFEPVEMVDQVVFDVAYEKHECQVFKLTSGYAVVVEEGCSCYEADWAVIDIVKTRRDAEKAMKAFKDNAPQRCKESRA